MNFHIFCFFSQVLKFLQQFIVGLDIRPDTVRIAAVSYSNFDSIPVWFPLDYYNQTDDVLSAITAEALKVPLVSGTAISVRQLFLFLTVLMANDVC